MYKNVTVSQSILCYLRYGKSIDKTWKDTVIDRPHDGSIQLVAHTIYTTGLTTFKEIVIMGLQKAKLTN